MTSLGKQEQTNLSPTPQTHWKNRGLGVVLAISPRGGAGPGLLEGGEGTG